MLWINLPGCFSSLTLSGLEKASSMLSSAEVKPQQCSCQTCWPCEPADFPFIANRETRPAPSANWKNRDQITCKAHLCFQEPRQRWNLAPFWSLNWTSFSILPGLASALFQQATNATSDALYWGHVSHFQFFSVFPQDEIQAAKLEAWDSKGKTSMSSWCPPPAQQAEGRQQLYCKANEAQGQKRVCNILVVKLTCNSWNCKISSRCNCY